MSFGLKLLNRRLKNRSDRRLYFAAIVRVSTNKQGSVLHGSLEQQNYFIDNYIKDLEKQLKCKIIVHKRIEEEVSGGEAAIAHRYELQEVLKLIEGNIIDGIIFEKLDRVSRDQVFNLRLLKTAHKMECAIIQVNKGFINLNNRSDRLSVNTENMFAEDYYFELQEKVQKKSRAARLNNGKDGQTVPVLGLDPHPTQAGFYIINKEEQKIVNEIYSLFLKTGSYVKVEEYCREKGYQRKSRMTQPKVVKGERIPPRKIGGGPITQGYLYYLLRNKKIRSIGSFKDTWEQYPDMQDEDMKVDYKYNHEPIVPSEIIAQVDALLEKRSKEQLKYGRFIYLLSGVFVTTDGKRLHSSGGNNTENGRYRYYTNNTLKYNIPKDEIEAIIIKRMKHYLAHSGTIHQLLENTLKNKHSLVPMIEEQIKQTKLKLEDARGKIDGFSNAIQSAVSDKTQNLTEVCKVLLEEKTKAQEKVEKLDTELRDLEHKKFVAKDKYENSTLPDFLKRTVTHFDRLPDAEKKKVIQTIFPKIVIDPEKTDKIELYVNPDPNGTVSPLSLTESNEGSTNCEFNKIGWAIWTSLELGVERVWRLKSVQSQA